MLADYRELLDQALSCEHSVERISVRMREPPSTIGVTEIDRQRLKPSLVHPTRKVLEEDLDLRKLAVTVLRRNLPSASARDEDLVLRFRNDCSCCR